MSQQDPIRRAIAALLSVLGPAVVLAVGWAALSGAVDAEEQLAIENAGRVVNAKVTTHGDVVSAMERMLALTEPEVLLIGPSYANTDVSPELLASRLGLPRDKVLMLSVPNSVGAHWYAILQNRVFANGHRPKLVVVISGLQSMLLATPLTEASYVNLAVHLDGEDPVLQAKVQTTTELAYARLREKRGYLRDRIFGVLRDLPPRLFVTSPVDPRVGVRPPEVRLALDRVFDDENVDMDLHVGSAPVAAFADERAYDPSVLPAPPDSFLPDTTDLVRAHGARMVWVRPPMSPDIPAHLDDVVLPGVQEGAIGLVHERGGTFLDMRGLPMSRDMFKNEDHMNAEGSRRFTEALAKALQELDALAPERHLDELPPLVPRVEVVGDAGPVPAAEAAWAGQGTWVGPGAVLRVSAEVPWEAARGPLAVHLVAEQLSPGDRPPVLAVRDREVPLEASVSRADWRAWGLDQVVRAPDGPLSLELRVPRDAAWLRVAAVALGEGDARVFALGDEVALEGASAGLFGVFRYEGGVMVDETVHPTYTAAPGKVPGADRPVEDAEGPVGRYATERWAFLSDESLIGETNFGSRCSPLRITDDGQELPLANVPCVEVQRQGGGRSCHTPDAIYFTAVDGSDPATNGRKYRLVLDDARRCDGAVWLYPRDHFTVAWPEERLAVFRRGADTLRFGARYLQKRSTEIVLTLWVGQEKRLVRKINGLELQDGEPLLLSIEPPLPPGARDVRLEVENTDLTFYLVEDATLLEGGAR